MFAGKLSIVKYVADILNFVLLPKGLHISNSYIYIYIIEVLLYFVKIPSI